MNKIDSFPNDGQSPWYRRILFGWVKPLLSYGYKHQLTEKNFFSLNEADEPSICNNKFSTTMTKYSHVSSPTFSALFVDNISIFILSLMFGGFYCITNLWLINLLKSFLIFIEMPNPSISKGAIFALGFCFLGTLSWVFIQHCFLSITKLSLRIRGALVMAIYERVFKLRSSDRLTISAGEMSNLMLQDTVRISVASQALVMLIVSVFLILAASALLYLQIGISGIIGTASAFIVIPLSNILNKHISSNSKSLMQISDIRISRMSELLSHIKAVKAMNWDKCINALIHQVRQSEIKLLKNLSWNTALLNLVIQSSPLFIAAITFATYVFLGKTLELPMVLSAIAIFGILKTPVMHIPRLIIQITDAKVSIERIDKIFRLKMAHRKNDDIVASLGSIQFNQANIGWTETESILKNITINIKPGELVSLIGASGSGKTSFLNAIIDEATILAGSCGKSGKVSYASQKSFIIFGSIRENILFGLEYDEQRYWRVIHACHLIEDLNEFSEYDLTQLTENGGNLSGGQKQRIALARTIYRDADIYILDDVFSALDEEVGKNVFNEVALKFLAGKTRVITSHRLEYAKQSDRILRFENGCLKEVTDKVAVNRAPLPLSSSSHSSVEIPIQFKQAMNKKLIANEDRKTGRVNKSIYYDYFKKAGGLRIFIYILLIFGIRELLAVGSDLWLSYGAATPIFNNHLVILVFSLLCILVASATLFRAVLLLKTSILVAERVHNEMLDSILKTSIQFFETNPIGRILNRFSRDLHTVDQEIGPRFLDAIGVFFVLFSAFIVIESANPFAIIVIGLIGYFYYQIQSYYRVTAPEINRLEAISQSPLFSHFKETLEGIVSIKTFTMTEKFSSQGLEKLRTSLRATFTQQVIAEWLSVNLDIMGVVLLGLIAFIATVARAHVSWSLAGLSVTYVMMVTINFQRAVHNVTDLEISMTSLERTNSFSNLNPENLSGKINPHNNWPEQGRIKFDNVTLIYHDNAIPVLKNVSFEILPGEKVGVIGRTGSGKSSLINALFRLVELQDGTILIDNIDISEIKMELLRSSIALLPQDPLMIAGTLRMNLDPYGQFTDHELIDSLKSTGLFSFYKNIPDALNYTLQVGGGNLSQGHRQLFSLARILLLNPKILILDEATANVDVETDRLVQDVIRKNFAQSTIITIAHRLETVINSDRILNLENGKVIDFACPKQLFSKEGSRLYGFDKINREIF